jgi:REP element-mobilizing transposase RayT
MYFITLVTQNRECNLGQINKGEMIFSSFGKIVNDEWLESFLIRDELLLDEYIIVPNHLHAIVILDKNRIEKNEMNGSDGSDGSDDSHVETHGRASLQSPQSQNESYKQPFVRKPKSISSFVGGFKSAVNSKIDDYIDEKIKNYIITNPLKWKDDAFNPDK